MAGASGARQASSSSSSLSKGQQAKTSPPVAARAAANGGVYGDASEHFDRSIDVQLCRLRRKLSASGLKGPVIRTIRNEGYMFVHAVTH